MKDVNVSWHKGVLVLDTAGYAYRHGDWNDERVVLVGVGPSGVPRTLALKVASTFEQWSGCIENPPCEMMEQLHIGWHVDDDAFVVDRRSYAESDHEEAPRKRELKVDERYPLVFP